MKRYGAFVLHGVIIMADYRIEIENRTVDGISTLIVWFGEHFIYIEAVQTSRTS